MVGCIFCKRIVYPVTSGLTYHKECYKENVNIKDVISPRRVQDCHFCGGLATLPYISFVSICPGKVITPFKYREIRFCKSCWDDAGGKMWFDKIGSYRCFET